MRGSILLASRRDTPIRLIVISRMMGFRDQRSLTRSRQRGSIKGFFGKPRTKSVHFLEFHTTS